MSGIKYLPPKSSIWGHRTGRKTPAEFHKGVCELLNIATKNVTLKNCIYGLNLYSTDESAIKFEKSFREMSGLSENMGFIDEKKFEDCLHWYFENYKIAPKKAGLVNFYIRRTYEIYSWSFEPGEAGKETSLLSECFGTIQFMGTHLKFNNMPEYYWVKSVVLKTTGIELNDKHIRPKINPAI